MAPVLDAPRRKREIHGRELDVHTGDTVIYVDPADGLWKAGVLQAEPAVESGEFSLSVRDVGNTSARARDVDHMAVPPRKINVLPSTNVTIGTDLYTYQIEPGPHGEEEYTLVNTANPTDRSADVHRVPRAVLEGYMHGAVLDTYEVHKEDLDYVERAEAVSRDMQKQLRDLEVKAKELEAKIRPLISKSKQLHKDKLKEYVAKIDELTNAFKKELETFHTALYEAEVVIEQERAQKKTKSRVEIEKEQDELDRNMELWEEQMSYGAEVKLWVEKMDDEADADDRMLQRQKEIFDDYEAAVAQAQQRNTPPPPAPPFTKPIEPLKTKEEILRDKYYEHYYNTLSTMALDPNAQMSTFDMKLIDRVEEERKKEGGGLDFTPGTKLYEDATKKVLFDLLGSDFTPGSFVAVAEAAKQAMEQNATTLRTESAATAQTNVDNFSKDKKIIETEIKDLRKFNKESLDSDANVERRIADIEARLLATTATDPDWKDCMNYLWDELADLHIGSHEKKFKADVTKEHTEGVKHREHKPISSTVFADLLTRDDGAVAWDALNTAFYQGDTYAIVRDFFTLADPPSEDILAELRAAGYDEWEDFVDYWQSEGAKAADDAINAWAESEIRTIAAEMVENETEVAVKNTGKRKVVLNIAMVTGGAALGWFAAPAVMGGVAGSWLGGALGMAAKSVGTRLRDRFWSKKDAKRPQSEDDEKVQQAQGVARGGAFYRHTYSGTGAHLNRGSLYTFADVLASSHRKMLSADKNASNDKLLLAAMGELKTKNPEALKYYETLLSGVNATTQKQIDAALAHTDSKALAAHNTALGTHGADQERAIPSVVGALAGDAFEPGSALARDIDAATDRAMDQFKGSTPAEVSEAKNHLRDLVYRVESNLKRLRATARAGGNFDDTDVLAAITELQNVLFAEREAMHLPGMIEEKKRHHAQLVNAENLKLLFEGAKSGGHGHGGKKEGKGHGHKKDKPKFTTASVREEIDNMQGRLETLPTEQIAALLSDPILRIRIENVLFEIRWAELEKARVREVTSDEMVAIERDRVRALSETRGSGGHGALGGTEAAGGAHSAARVMPDTHTTTLAPRTPSSHGHDTGTRRKRDDELQFIKPKSSKLGRLAKVAGIAGTMLAGGNVAMNAYQNNKVESIAQEAERSNWTPDAEVKLLVLRSMRGELEKQIKATGKVNPETIDKAAYTAAQLLHALKKRSHTVGSVTLPDNLKDIIEYKNKNIVVHSGVELEKDVINKLAKQKGAVAGVTVSPITPEELPAYLQKLGLAEKGMAANPTTPASMKRATPITVESGPNLGDGQGSYTTVDGAEQPLQVGSSPDWKNKLTNEIPNPAGPGPLTKKTAEQSVPVVSEAPAKTEPAPAVEKPAPVAEPTPAPEKVTPPAKEKPTASEVSAAELGPQIVSVQETMRMQLSSIVGANDKTNAELRGVKEKALKKLTDSFIHLQSTLKNGEAMNADDKRAAKAIQAFTKGDGGGGLAAIALEGVPDAKRKAFELLFQDTRGSQQEAYQNGSAGLLLRNGDRGFAFVYVEGFALTFDENRREIVMINNKTGNAIRTKLQ